MVEDTFGNTIVNEIPVAEEAKKQAVSGKVRLAQQIAATQRTLVASAITNACRKGDNKVYVNIELSKDLGDELCRKGYSVVRSHSGFVISWEK